MLAAAASLVMQNTHWMPFSMKHSRVKGDEAGQRPRKAQSQEGSDGAGDRVENFSDPTLPLPHPHFTF